MNLPHTVARGGSGDEPVRQRLQEIVVARVERGRYSVPAMPEVAVRCLELMKVPMFGLREAAQLLERDQALAAQVVRQANSPLLGAGTRVRTIEQALMRVGMQRLRTVLIEACARRLAEIRDPLVASVLRGLWDHSLAVAVLARELCPHGPGLDREAAYLAGLLHDLGKPVVAGILLEEADALSGASRLRMDPSQWLPLVFRCHRSVGACIAETWRLPDTVATCIANTGWYDQRHPLTITNVVRLAHVVARAERFDVCDGETPDDEAQMAVGAKLLGIELETVTFLAQTLRQRLGFVDEQ